MRITSQQIRYDMPSKLWIIYVAGEGFQDFERSFKERKEAVSWINSLIALLNLRDKDAA